MFVEIGIFDHSSEAPLGVASKCGRPLRGFGNAKRNVCYKHFAPLGLMLLKSIRPPVSISPFPTTIQPRSKRV